MGYAKISEAEMGRMVKTIKDRRKLVQKKIKSMESNKRGQKVMDLIFNNNYRKNG